MADAASTDAAPTDFGGSTHSGAPTDSGPETDAARRADAVPPVDSWGGTVRAAIRLMGVVSWTVGSCATYIIPMDVLCDLQARGLLPWKGVHATRARIVRFFFRVVSRIMGLRIEVRGERPDPPFLMVSNHMGYLDVFLFMSQLPVALVSKAAVRGWPVVGYLVKVGGTIFINRNSRRDILRINETLEQALDRGQGVIFFPEGTSTAGDRVLPFRASLLAPVAASDRPVWYATVNYSTPEGAPPAWEVAAWWGDMTFADHFWRLLSMPRVDATVTIGRLSPKDEDRKELAARLTEAVRKSFEPIPGAQEAAESAEAPYLKRV